MADAHNSKTQQHRDAARNPAARDPVPGMPSRADYASPSLVGMAASTLGLWPLTPFKGVVLADAAIAAIIGFVCLFAPGFFAAVVNAGAAWAKLPAALVIRSDTSTLLVRVLGTALVAAAAVAWRIAARNDRDGGGALLLTYKAAALPLLAYAYAAGGPTHGLLLPVLGYIAATAAALLYACPPASMIKAAKAIAQGLQHVA